MKQLVNTKLLLKIFFIILNEIFGKHFQTVPDGLCMARAILMQVPHHPHNYTAEMAMRQVTLYCKVIRISKHVQPVTSKAR